MKNALILSVILPAYNEADRIYENSLAVSKEIGAFCESYEIIVVDDGSDDKTRDEASRAASVDTHIKSTGYKKNRGKGSALRFGTSKATGARIAFCDADLDLNPRQLERFMKIMDETGAAAVIGSKLHKDSKVDYPFIRRIYSFGYYLFLLILFQLNAKDTQTGLKLFSSEYIKPTMERILVKRFACDIEILSIIKKRGGKIVSAPVEVNFQRGTFGRIDIRDAFSIFIDTLAVYYRLNILHYYDE